MNEILNIHISKEIPMIYTELNKRFGVDWNNGIIIADGDTIYCKYDLVPQKVIHEIVHLKQQGKIGKDLWWQTYLSNDTFRLEQELEAYKREYQFIKDNIKDRNQRFEHLYDLARDLSSETYGKIIPFNEAMKLIQSQ